MTVVDFAARNTPLQPMDRLGAALGLEPGCLWCKRDDLTGLPAGGNKARKLERLVAAAVADGCDVLVTGGAAQSNHVRATGAAARAAGLECVAVLAEPSVPERVEGNLVLDDLLAVQVVWTSIADRHRAMDDTIARLEADGRRPYRIPLGGSSPVGAAAYADCAAEIVADGRVGSSPTIITAVGTGGTYAGLAVGLGDHGRVVGVDVAAVPDVVDTLGPLTDAVAEHLGAERPAGEIRLDRSQASRRYGEAYDELFATLRLVAETEGLVLDPVYSGRAMTGLVRALRADELTGHDPLVFVHTGGMPALFTGRYADRFVVRTSETSGG